MKFNTNLLQVVRRPYVFIYRDERDPIERAVINLANAHVEYSEDQEQMVRMPNTFRYVTLSFIIIYLCNKIWKHFCLTGR